MTPQAIAQALDASVLKRKATSSLRTDNPYDLKQAYDIQELGVRLRESRGEKRSGVKLGFTSRAKMQQMGVDHLIWGTLTDAMRFEEGGELPADRFIHPRIEPEVGFLTRRDISTPLTLAEISGVLEGVFSALEIIDSRYQQFKFTLEDVVADNTSSAGYVIGPMRSPGTDVSNCGVNLLENGRVVQTGSSAAILGHPLRALVQVSQLLYDSGRTLPAGSVILAGAATAAHAIASGAYYSADIAGLGVVSVRAK